MNKYVFSTLTDIDECREDIDNCSQNCSDTLGSYQCICYDGYTLDSDEHTCNGLCLEYFALCHVCPISLQMMMNVLVV